jgi:hypothetical protein
LGDGLCDGEDEAWGVDLSCYEADGGDCLDPECGDGFCNGDETFETCPEDCEEPASCDTCVNSYSEYGAGCCDAALTIWGMNCQFLTDNYGWDCTGCACPNDENYEPPAPPACGDGVCNGDETYETCPDDCLAPGECAEGYIADCAGDGDCAPEGWVGDGLCDGEDQGWGVNLTCFENDGGDCDENPFTDPDATTAPGTCADDEVADCTGDGDCAPASWIGDGLCDGADQEWDVDLSCYENDGGDCAVEDTYVAAIEFDIAMQGTQAVEIGLPLTADSAAFMSEATETFIALVATANGIAPDNVNLEIPTLPDTDDSTEETTEEETTEEETAIPSLPFRKLQKASKMNMKREKAKAQMKFSVKKMNKKMIKKDKKGRKLQAVSSSSVDEVQSLIGSASFTPLATRVVLQSNGMFMFELDFEIAQTLSVELDPSAIAGLDDAAISLLLAAEAEASAINQMAVIAQAISGSNNDLKAAIQAAIDAAPEGSALSQATVGEVPPATFQMETNVEVVVSTSSTMDDQMQQAIDTDSISDAINTDLENTSTEDLITTEDQLNAGLGGNENQGQEEEEDVVCSEHQVMDCLTGRHCNEASLVGDGVCHRTGGVDLTCYTNDGGDCDDEEDVIMACDEGDIFDCDGTGQCINQNWVGDGICDNEFQNYGADLSCYGNDGGDCDTTTTTTRAPETDDTDDTTNEDDAVEATTRADDEVSETTSPAPAHQNGCLSGQVEDCDGGGQCFDATWVGDGFCDGLSQDYGANLLCHDNDGGDCEDRATTARPEDEETTAVFVEVVATEAAADGSTEEATTQLPSTEAYVPEMEEVETEYENQNSSAIGDGASGNATDPNSSSVSSISTMLTFVTMTICVVLKF